MPISGTILTFCGECGIISIEGGAIMSEKLISDLVKYDDIHFAVQAKDSEHKFIPLHWHSYYEVELFISGRAAHIANGKVYSFSPGDVSVMKPTDFHSYIPEDDSFRVKKFIFMSDKISTNIEGLLSELPCALSTGKMREHFEEMFDCLIASCANRTEFGCLLSRNLAERIFIELAMCGGNMAGKSESSSNSDQTERLSEVLAYISEHFTERISLSDAAKEVNLSPDYLSRFFSKKLGTTFSNYLKLKRLQYATALLISGKYSIEEIASCSGFPSLTFFNRTFKAQYGVSPLEYRKGHGNGG